MRACMTMVLVGSVDAMSWKFLTEASFTRPRKLRHQQRRLSFQCGGLLRSSTPCSPPTSCPAGSISKPFCHTMAKHATACEHHSRCTFT